MTIPARFSQKILLAGKILFLLGVAFLIIRKNTYPWPLKRASDVFFLLSALSALSYAALRREWNLFVRAAERVRVGLALIFSGLFLASLAGYFIQDVSLGTEGWLSLGRFTEVAVILLLVGFFQSQDANFFKKIAIAQLSTLAYLGALLIPNDLDIHLYRFELFENWPSNVAYYLLVSLSLFIVFALQRLKPLQWKFLLFYVPAAGLFAIFLWAQSRASWIGFVIATLLILGIWSIKAGGGMLPRFLFGGLLSVSLVITGFLILPSLPRGEVIIRFSPSPQMPVQTDGLPLVQKSPSPSPAFGFYEPSRPYLWNAYTEKIADQPLGFGLNYAPIWYEGSARGPHNTILELIVLGGYVTLAGFLYLLYRGFGNVAAKLKESRDTAWPLYVFASLTALVVVSLFDNMSTFRLLWIVLGMAIYL
ncbi:MAG: hypothetical protein HY435_02945 [Candidatus Liptonbacteria bacterium]|nr:hypothetical protein [Candidatus Liptonbacteria bacterium]